MWLKRPVYRGFKGEGKCEGRAFTLTPALTLPSHFRQESILSGIPWMSEAKVPEKYSYLVPTVQHSYTNSVAMLHCQCKGAAPLVPECCTFTGTIRSCGFSGVYEIRQYSYGILSVYLCWTLGTR